MKAFRISFLSIHLASIVIQTFYIFCKNNLFIKNVKNNLKMNNENVVERLSELQVSDDDNKEDDKGKKI